MARILSFPLRRAAQNARRSPFVNGAGMIDFDRLARLIEAAERAAPEGTGNVVNLASYRSENPVPARAGGQV